MCQNEGASFFIFLPPVLWRACEHLAAIHCKPVLVLIIFMFVCYFVFSNYSVKIQNKKAKCKNMIKKECAQH